MSYGKILSYRVFDKVAEPANGREKMSFGSGLSLSKWQKEEFGDVRAKPVCTAGGGARCGIA
ncbi:MAG: hypothetical protein Hens3KO_20980 [Henriciella sp.]